jgi:hypothetical protein
MTRDKETATLRDLQLHYFRVWGSDTQVYPATVNQAKVLLVVSHPSVGSGIETLLNLERRYEVRRATTLDEAVET